MCSKEPRRPGRTGLIEWSKNIVCEGPARKRQQSLSSAPMLFNELEVSSSEGELYVARSWGDMPRAYARIERWAE